MNELLAKISSYSLFNYLLPGIVFTALASDILHYPIAQRDLLTAAFLYYFAGLVISRFGSLVIEPILKRFAFVHFSDYKDFLAPSEKDGQLPVLPEANNTYRPCPPLSALSPFSHYFLHLTPH